MGEHIMAYILPILGIGIFWILKTLYAECKNREKEKSIVNFLAEEIKKLRKDVDNLKR